MLTICRNAVNVFFEDSLVIGKFRPHEELDVARTVQSPLLALDKELWRRLISDNTAEDRIATCLRSEATIIRLAESRPGASIRSQTTFKIVTGTVTNARVPSL